MGRVARSIAQGQGFSSPYEGNTGPTAWEPPLYPYLMAGVFKLFGIYTHASAWVLLSINSLLATAGTCIPIYRIAQRTFGERWQPGPLRLGIESIHLVLVHPLDLDTTFTPLVLAWIFLLALELAGVARRPCPSGVDGTPTRQRGSSSVLCTRSALWPTHDARLPSLLRSVGLAPETSPWLTLFGWRWPCLLSFSLQYSPHG